MAIYKYFCSANNKSITISHPIDAKVRNWGELCFLAQEDIGDTEFLAPITKVLQPSFISVPTSNSTLKEKGFTKLVRRERGVYENVTADYGESKYMTAGDKKSIPDLTKKIKD